MSNGQLFSTPMVARKSTWNLPSRHCDCKVGYRWLLRWWELIRDHHCGLPTILRVTAGTSIDITLRPHPLTQKEDLLLLSLWRRYWHVPKGSALGTWLTNTNKELGPDNEESPHKFASPLNVAHPATTNNVRTTAGLEFLSKLPPSIPTGRCVETELRLLITAFEIENMDLGVLVSVLLAGVIPDNFPVKMGWFGLPWQAVPHMSSGMKRKWNIAYTLLADVRTTRVVVTNGQGDTVY